MEAYTNIKIEMENNEIAVKAVEEAKAAIMKDMLYKKDEQNVSRFINDIKVSEGTVIVDNSCSIDSWEFENLIPIIVKVVATMTEVRSFEGFAHYTSCNCGYEADFEANYWNGTLTIESVSAEDYYGSCDECGEFEIYYKDYDPSKTYICEECGKVLTEKDLFPYGVPKVEVECYDI